jgi:flagellar biosynthesis protein FlhF
MMMFVGPPGAGKTTTIAKLAVRLGLQRRIPVHLLSLDTMRVGGSEQLATYARILGVGFDSIYTTAALGQALEEHGAKKLILIDSPGYAPAEMEEAAQIARFLQHYPEIEVQLVLPAYLSASALTKFSQRFSLFQPEKLLFTHLDEVETTGPIVEHAVRSELPVSFLADGQSITSDLHDATKSKLTEGLFNVRAARTAA